MPVYLLHLDPPYKQARHYLGYADDTLSRLALHRMGRGARLTQVAVQAGCELVLARVWEDGDRTLERKLKRQKMAPRLCPICAAKAAPTPHQAQLELPFYDLDLVEPIAF